MFKLYGIKNCDTVKKAIKQLAEQQTDYEFIDLKTVTLPHELLHDWLSQHPQTLVNKRSTTYRQIKNDWLAAENDVNRQIELIQANPTLIKRPVLERADNTIIIGYDTTKYTNL